MTGNKSNKSESGQVLLVTIMLLATALTVVMTNAFKSITDTQTTKLEEESQKALAAAEAGIEQSLNQKTAGTPANITIGEQELSGIKAVSTNVVTTTSKLYTTPLLAKDSQYTFYLTNYPNASTYWSGSNLIIYYYSENNNPALEVTLIDKNNSLFDRKIIQDASVVSGSNFSSPTSGSYAKDGITFKRKFDLGAISNNKLLIVRVLGSTTRLGFESATDFFKQGEVISSEAKTSTNVVKKVELRQSYPQIPAEFFVTSF